MQQDRREVCRSAWNPFSLNSAMPAVRNAGCHCALPKTLMLIALPCVLVNSSRTAGHVSAAFRSPSSGSTGP
jgi:hypothetical protein